MKMFDEILRSVPTFPNYSYETFGYPERLIRKSEDSLVVLGPPIRLYYDFMPQKACQVHVSGIPDWASMSDLVDIFERFGRLFSIELSVCIKPEVGHKSLSCNGWARVTFISYDGAQKALFAHLTRRIPGTLSPLSIYKGAVSNVILLKNIPASEPKAKVIELLNEYPGVVSIAFTNQTTARMTFHDLDLALLFMDIVSKGELVIEGFTCSVDIDPEEDEDENDMFFTADVQAY